MARARWTKTFAGDLTGTGVVELIMGQVDGPSPGNGSIVYVGLERFECTGHGRGGTFVLVRSANAHGEQSNTSGTILAGSGTNQLATSS